MHRFASLHLVAPCLVLAFLALAPGAALADGTETLGAPSIPIASGDGFAIGGVGLFEEDAAEIHVDVPDVVRQVLIYWEGQSRGKAEVQTDDSIEVEGHEVQGTLIGGPSHAIDVFTRTYRADITDLGLVGVGSNTLEVAGVDFQFASNGAGILVIYGDGAGTHLELRDGNDFAFDTRPAYNEAFRVTETQVFDFAPAPFARLARIPIFVGSVADDRLDESEPERPSVILIETGGQEQRFQNLLGSHDGLFWDSVMLEVPVPEGASSLSARILSLDELDTGYLPASLVWVAGGLALESAGVCQVEVEAFCSVPFASPETSCDTKVAATTLRWVGEDLPNATVVLEGKDALVTYADIHLEPNVTVLSDPAQAGFSIDARDGDLGSKLSIWVNGIEEVIHTSCSAPYIAGERAPLDSPKGAPSPHWVVEDFVQKDGRVVTPDASPALAKDCRIALSKTKAKKVKKAKKLKDGKVAKVKKAKKLKTKKGKGGSGEVLYTYVLRQTGTLPTRVQLQDDQGLLGDGVSVAVEPGEPTTLSRMTTLEASTTSVVTATDIGGVCVGDRDTVTVTVDGIKAKKAKKKKKK